MKKIISFIGKVIWFLFTGLEMGLTFISFGIVWCLSIIGIPFGKQCFKISALIFFPTDKTVNMHFKKHIIANILWIIFGGIFIAGGFLFLGIIWCVTIFGVTKGLKCFKFAKLALMPFGAEIEKERDDKPRSVN